MRGIVGCVLCNAYGHVGGVKCGVCKGWGELVLEDGWVERRWGDCPTVNPSGPEVCVGLPIPQAPKERGKGGEQTVGAKLPEPLDKSYFCAKHGRLREGEVDLSPVGGRPYLRCLLCAAEKN